MKKSSRAEYVAELVRHLDECEADYYDKLRLGQRLKELTRIAKDNLTIARELLCAQAGRTGRVL